MYAAGIADFTHAGNLTFPTRRTVPGNRGVVGGLGGTASGEQGDGRDEQSEKGLLRRFHDDAINGGGA